MATSSSSPTLTTSTTTTLGTFLPDLILKMEDSSNPSEFLVQSTFSTGDAASTKPSWGELSPEIRKTLQPLVDEQVHWKQERDIAAIDAFLVYEARGRRVAEEKVAQLFQEVSRCKDEMLEYQKLAVILKGERDEALRDVEFMKKCMSDQEKDHKDLQSQNEMYKSRLKDVEKELQAARNQVFALRQVIDCNRVNNNNSNNNGSTLTASPQASPMLLFTPPPSGPAHHHKGWISSPQDKKANHSMRSSGGRHGHKSTAAAAALEDSHAVLVACRHDVRSYLPEAVLAIILAGTATIATIRQAALVNWSWRRAAVRGFIAYTNIRKGILMRKKEQLGIASAPTPLSSSMSPERHSHSHCVSPQKQNISPRINGNGSKQQQQQQQIPHTRSPQCLRDQAGYERSIRGLLALDKQSLANLRLISRKPSDAEMLVMTAIGITLGISPRKLGNGDDDYWEPCARMLAFDVNAINTMINRPIYQPPPWASHHIFTSSALMQPDCDANMHPVVRALFTWAKALHDYHSGVWHEAEELEKKIEACDRYQLRMVHILARLSTKKSHK